MAGKPREDKHIASLKRTQAMWLDSLSPKAFRMLWPVYEICFDRQNRNADWKPEDPDEVNSPQSRLYIKNVATGVEYINPNSVVKAPWGCYIVSKTPFSCDIDRFSVLIKQGDDLRLYSIIEYDRIIHDLCELATRRDLKVNSDMILKCISSIDELYREPQAWSMVNKFRIKTKKLGDVTYATEYYSYDVWLGQFYLEKEMHPDQENRFIFDALYIPIDE